MFLRGTWTAIHVIGGSGKDGRSYFGDTKDGEGTIGAGECSSNKTVRNAKFS
jgi:hypothetical protein